MKAPFESEVAWPPRWLSRSGHSPVTLPLAGCVCAGGRIAGDTSQRSVLRQLEAATMARQTLEMGRCRT